MSQTLGNVLRTLLDTGEKPFTRAEWAKVLECSETDLENWVNDQVLPPHDRLRSILILVSEDNPALLNKWDEIADLPLRDVVPKLAYFKMPIEQPRITTPGMYALWYRYQGVLRRLSTLTYKKQEEFLDYAVNEFFPRHELE